MLQKRNGGIATFSGTLAVMHEHKVSSSSSDASPGVLRVVEAATANDPGFRLNLLGDFPANSSRDRHVVSKKSLIAISQRYGMVFEGVSTVRIIFGVTFPAMKAFTKLQIKSQKQEDNRRYYVPHDDFETGIPAVFWESRIE